MYQNAARTVIWGSYLWGFAARPPTINLPLGSDGVQSGSRNVYARVFGGQTTVPPGSYASNLTTADIIFRYRQGTNRACTSSATGWQTFTGATTVTATVAADCLVSANNIDFGTSGVLLNPVDAAGAVGVRCTVGTAYSIGLNGGLANAPPAARLMTKGAEAITYGIYKDAARSQIWGDASLPGGTVSGTGNGLLSTRPTYGRVPAQPTPSPGTYSDIVVVTVTY
jgi:spore coat protein U-like protein